MLGTATDLMLNGAYVPDGTKWLDRARLRRHGCQLSVLDTVLITELVKYNPAVERLRCVPRVSGVWGCMLALAS